MYSVYKLGMSEFGKYVRGGTESILPWVVKVKGQNEHWNTVSLV